MKNRVSRVFGSKFAPRNHVAFLLGHFISRQRLQIMRSKTSWLYLKFVLGVLRPCKEVIIAGHLNCNLLPKWTTESDCIKTTQGATETRKPYSAHKSAHSYYSILQNGRLEKPETGIGNSNRNGNADWNRKGNRRRNRNRNSNVNENRYKNRDTINLNIF